MLDNEIEGGFGVVFQWVVCQVSQIDGMEGMCEDFELRREPAMLMEQKEGQQRIGSKWEKREKLEREDRVQNT